MKLKCKRKGCEHEWEYKGNSRFYACCPKCKSSIRIVYADDEQTESK